MLEIGTLAPDFDLADAHGTSVVLSQHRGRWVMLWWYPEANSRGCSLQAASLEQNLDDIERAGAVVLGVSFNTPDENDQFACDKSLRFTLLSNPDRRTGAAYGVLRGDDEPYPTKPNRHTFIIDPEGRIAFAEDANEVDLTRYGEHMLAVLRRLKSDRVSAQGRGRD